MANKIVIEDSLKEISGELKEVIRSTIQIAQEHLPIEYIEVVVKKAGDTKILEDIQGVGGYCPRKDSIELSIDALHSNVRTDLQSVVKRSLLHELHHAARWTAGVAFDETLQDMLVTEGLADCFVEELTGEQTIWTTTVKGEEFERLMKEIGSELRSDQFSYEDWFIKGSKERAIPRWAGYAIGHHLVKEYLSKFQRTAAESYNLNSNKVIVF